MNGSEQITYQEKMEMVRKHEAMSAREKAANLQKDEKLQKALDYIKLLLSTSAFPGGPQGEPEIAARRFLAALDDPNSGPSNSIRSIYLDNGDIS